MKTNQCSSVRRNSGVLIDFRGHFAMISLAVSLHQTELNSPGNEYIGESFQDESVDLDPYVLCQEPTKSGFLLK
jgi:hypothetical protein